MNIKHYLAFVSLIPLFSSCGGGSGVQSPTLPVSPAPPTGGKAGESYIPGNLPPGKVSSPEIVANNVAQVAIARTGNRTLISWYSVENSANLNELTHRAVSRVSNTTGSAIKLGAVDTSTDALGPNGHTNLILRDIPIILSSGNAFVGTHIGVDFLNVAFTSIGGTSIDNGVVGITRSFVVAKTMVFVQTGADIKKARNSDSLFAAYVDTVPQRNAHVGFNVRSWVSTEWAASTSIPISEGFLEDPNGDAALSTDGKSLTAVYFGAYRDRSMPSTAKPKVSGWVVDGAVDGSGAIVWGTPNELPAISFSTVGAPQDVSSASVVVERLSDNTLLVAAPAILYGANDVPDMKYLVSWLRGSDGTWTTKLITKVATLSSAVHVLKLTPDANGGAVLLWTDNNGLFEWLGNRVSIFQNGEWSAPLKLTLNQRVVSDDGHIVLLTGDDYAIYAQKVTVADDMSIKLGGKTRIVNGAILFEKDANAIRYLYAGAMDQGHVSVAWITDPRKVDNGFGPAPQAGTLVLAEFDYSDLQD